MIIKLLIVAKFVSCVKTLRKTECIVVVSSLAFNKQATTFFKIKKTMERFTSYKQKEDKKWTVTSIQKIQEINVCTIFEYWTSDKSYTIFSACGQSYKPFVWIVIENVTEPTLKWLEDICNTNKQQIKRYERDIGIKLESGMNEDIKNDYCHLWCSGWKEGIKYKHNRYMIRCLKTGSNIELEAKISVYVMAKIMKIKYCKNKKKKDTIDITGLDQVNWYEISGSSYMFFTYVDKHEKIQQQRFAGNDARLLFQEIKIIIGDNVKKYCAMKNQNVM